MRYRIWIQAIFVVVLICVLALSAMAADWTIKVNVPFAFQVGNTRMPAGLYTVTRHNSNDLLLINNLDGKAIFSPSIRMSPNGKSDAALVFHVVGNSYYLNQVRVSGGYATELLPSKAEIESLARLNAPVQIAVVVGK